MADPQPSPSCPHRPIDERKTATLAGPQNVGDIERRPDGSVRIGSFALARQVLRGGGTRQAGFNAELIERFRTPNVSVLFQEGEAHQKQRTAAARFFAPKVVTTRYRALMTDLSDKLVDRFRRDGRADLDAMSLDLAVAVAAEIVGLTSSLRPGMAERLNRFFEIPAGGNGARLRGWLGFLRSQRRVLNFYWLDVRPAIWARRRVKREDVISHLLEQGWSDREILTECLTYGAAGMATTREFIVVAAWHLLEREDVRARFLAVDEAGRTAILEEILRLEPVIGALYRRTERALSLDEGRRVEEIAAGTLVAIDVRSANADPAAAGTCPLRIDPDRVRPDPRGPASLLSFGDGHHRCPGAAVALQETAIFLDRLLRVPNIELDRAPVMAWNPLITGYELRGATVVVRA